jgi:hypothetical protein
MFILETIFFVATVVLSLVFLYQLSPSAVVSNTYTYDLKTLGDDALYSLYNDVIPMYRPQGYPSSKMVHYLLTNSYGNMVSDLNNLLPPNVMYNIYVSNYTKSEFWCNSFGQWDFTPGDGDPFDDPAILTPIDPVTVSHCLVSMDFRFNLSAERAGFYDHIDIADADTYRFRMLDGHDINSWKTSDLEQLFWGYDGKILDLRVEMWYL